MTKRIKLSNKDRNQARAFARDLCKSYGVKLIIRKETKEYAAEVSFSARTITLWGEDTVEGMLSSVFHELGHLRCEEAGIFLEYNTDNALPYDYTIAAALLAEQVTDLIGRIMMRQFLPDIKYDDWYIRNPKKALRFLEKEVAKYRSKDGIQRKNHE